MNELSYTDISIPLSLCACVSATSRQLEEEKDKRFEVILVEHKSPDETSLLLADDSILFQS